mmetsp:Transcript_26375/g.61976  ORF Transcript_26375/g.61976 Transcript_26375/m.61976 type:complete len:209 (-) Transcript_26375:601-1227(-)
MPFRTVRGSTRFLEATAVSSGITIHERRNSKTLDDVGWLGRRASIILARLSWWMKNPPETCCYCCCLCLLFPLLTTIRRRVESSKHPIAPTPFSKRLPNPQRRFGHHRRWDFRGVQVSSNRSKTCPCCCCCCCCGTRAFLLVDHRRGCRFRRELECHLKLVVVAATHDWRNGHRPRRHLFRSAAIGCAPSERTVGRWKSRLVAGLASS